MKRILHSLLLLVMAVAVSSCADTAKEKLKAEFEKANQECPVDLGTTGVMASISYDAESNTAVFEYILNEEYTNIASLRKAGDAQKSFMAAYLKSAEGERILKSLIDAKATLKLKFIGDKSHEETILTITPEELAQIDNSDASSNNAMAQMQSMVEISNAQCPQDLGDGLVMTGNVIEGTYVVYTYNYDVEQIPMTSSLLPELKEATGEALAEELNQLGNKQQKQLMNELGLGIKYVYNPVNGEGEIIEIGFTPEEVADM